MTLKLNKIYKLDELNLEWCEFWDCPPYTYDLPTQVVVAEPRIVTPKQARAFLTNRYVHDGEIVDYDTLITIHDSKGSDEFDRVFMVEVWVDGGSDGDIIYRLYGWQFVVPARLKPENCRPHTSIPACMIY